MNKQAKIIHIIQVKLNLVLVFFLTFIVPINAETLYPSLSENRKQILIEWLKADERCSNSYFSNDQTYSKDTIVDCFDLSFNFFYRPNLHSKVKFHTDSHDNDFIVEALAEKLLMTDLSENLLTRIVEIVVTSDKSDVELVKKLINKGASTKNIDFANDMLQSSEYNCEILGVITRNNEQLYRNKTAKHWNDALMSITHTGMHYSICPRVIELLINYSPEQLNYQNFRGQTPLMQIVIEHARVEPDLIVKLMTKKNVAMVDSDNANVMHYLLYPEIAGRDKTDDMMLKYVSVIVEFIRFGGDICASDKEGKSSLNYLKNYPKTFKRVNVELEKENFKKLK